MSSDKEHKISAEIDNIAYKYSTSDQIDRKEALALLNYFNPMFKDIAGFLYHGAEPEGRVSENIYQLLGGEKTLSVVSNILSSFAFEDIVQEIKLLFLEFAKNYDPEKQNNNIKKKFTFYVSRNFHYYIKQNYISDLSDTPICESLKNVQDELYKHINLPNLEDDFFNKEIDSNWLQGETCSEFFANLNKIDRKILQDYYMNGIEVRKIAKKLNIHPSNVYRKLEEIKTQIVEGLDKEIAKN